MRTLFGRRRNSGCGPVILIFGVLGLLGACATIALGVPFGILRAREVSNLPQFSEVDLDGAALGEAGLFTVRIPQDAQVGDDGLALAYEESRPLSNSNENSNDNSSSWTRQTPPPSQYEAGILTLNLPPDVSFLNATQQSSSDESLEYRAVGYLPGQALAVEGRWEGDNIITAEVLYAGSIEDYRESVSRRPFQLLFFGLTCLGISILLLLAGGVMRLLAR